MKKFILLIIACSSVLVVVTPYWVANRKPNEKNGFVRRIISDKLTHINTTTVQSAHLYFAGSNHHYVYLAKSTAPLQLIELNQSDYRVIHLQNPFDPILSESEIQLDSPYVYVSDLKRHKIFKGGIDNWQLTEEVVQNGFYSAYVPISNGSLALRVFSDDSSQYVLAKRNHQSTFTPNSTSLLEKQIDGFFCTDGMLRYDNSRKLLAYIYFYRNQFICADTNLNLVYRGKTIDTTHYARIKVGKLKNASMLASPPFIVNRRAIVERGRLYINSTLKGDNENITTFNASDVIDVYDLSTGTYEYSFYIPRFQNIRLRHFTVNGDNLYALHDAFLNVYSLKPDSALFSME